MQHKERLDVLLVNRGLSESREKAKATIMAGLVFVDNQRVDKAGTCLLYTSQAKHLGEFFSHTHLDAVYSSTLQRAMATAECVAAPHGLSVIPDESLKEADFGEWEGHTYEEITTKWPGELEACLLYTSRNKKTATSCTYAQAWFKRHTEEQDLLG